MVPDVKQGKQLPEGWEFKQLSSLFQERRETSSDLEKYPLYSLTIEEGLIEKPERYNREFLLKNRQDNQYRLVYPGDFVFNPMNLRWGAIAMSSLSKPVTVSAYYNVLTPDSSIISSNLLLTILQSPQILNVYDTVGKGTLVEKKRVHLNVFLKLKIPVPPITQSKKINAILSSVDEAIASTQAVIDQTRKVKQGLLQQLLTRGIGHTKFKESAIGKIPEKWQICSVAELGTFSNGHGFKPEEWSDKGVPIIRIQNLKGSQDFNYYAGVPDPKWIVNPGELLFAWAGVKGVSFGPCIWSGSVGVLNQHIYRIKPQPGIDKYWLFWTLEEITKQIEGHAHGFKYSLLHVRKADIVGQLVAFPPFEEQQEIAKRLASISEFKEKHQSSLDRLTRLKRGLMQDLLTGKVRVGCTS